MRQAFERHAKIPGGGYSNVDSVHDLPANTTKQDKQETWWFAETLKYLVRSATCPGSSIDARRAVAHRSSQRVRASYSCSQYLIFSDDDELLSLERWVFSTEAHPFPIVASASSR